MSDLSDVECELRQLTIDFMEIYAPSGNDVADMSAIVSFGVDEVGRFPVGRVTSAKELRGALLRLADALEGVVAERASRR